NYAPEHLDLLAQDGRWVLIGLMGGRNAELDLAKVLVKRLQLTGSTLRTRSADFKAGLLARMEEKLWPLFESGQLKPLVARTYTFDQAEEAIAELARDPVVGKIVLVNNGGVKAGGPSVRCPGFAPGRFSYSCGLDV